MKRVDIAAIGIDSDFSDYMKSAGEIASWSFCWAIYEWANALKKNHRSKKRFVSAFSRAVSCYESTFNRKLVPF